ncbi:MAG TPA: amidohydrolase family protein [Longimicrobiales bacterium]
MPNASGAQAPARRVPAARTAKSPSGLARATEPDPPRAWPPALAPASALLIALAAGLGPAAQPAGAQPARAADSAQALAAFRSNIAAIHARDRARYLEHYLQSPRLVRAGPAGLQYGYAPMAGSRDDTWPDTLVASHFRVTPLADGVVYGAYHYRVTRDGVSSRGISERLFVRTPDGWKIAVTTAFDSPPGTPPPPIAFTGATLVDGTGAAPVPDAVVVIRNGRIACAGPRSACPIEDDVETIDARGKWIIPGLVDAHVHYSQTGFADGRPDALDLRERFPYERAIADLRAHPERFYRSYLCTGVTATFDVGGYPWTWDLRDDAERSTLAPHVAAAGPLLSTRDHWLNLPAERQFMHIHDEASTRAGARFLAAHDADAFKVWFLIGRNSPDTALARTLIRAAGEEAARAGKPLIVHATGLWQAKLALEAGAKLLVHSVEDADVDDEFIRLARRNGTVYTPTLVVYQGYQQLRARSFDASRYELPCVDPATRAKAFLTDSLPGRPDAATLARMEEAGRERYRQMLRNVKRLHDAGIPIAMGTDAGNPLTLHGPAVYLEMEAMQEAGLTPLEVLTAATRNGALAMGRLDDFGTVERGKIADLVVLDADPTADIRNVRRVALVVRGGEVWTRRELEYGAAARAAASQR